MTVNKTRRGFLKWTGAVTAGVMCGLIDALPASARETIGYKVSIHNIHTDETFSGVYRVGKYYSPKAFRQINRLMRDHRTGDIHPIDPRLIDIVSKIQKQCRCSQPVELLSGFRSPKTNTMLRRKSRGVAKNSYHTKGQAADIQIPGASTKKTRNAALALRAGGVGYYPRKSFVHVDTGDVRTWTA